MEGLSEFVINCKYPSLPSGHVHRGQREPFSFIKKLVSKVSFNAQALCRISTFIFHP